MHIRQTHTHREIFLRGNATLALESPSSSFARKHFTLCQAITYFFRSLFHFCSPFIALSLAHTHTHSMAVEICRSSCLFCQFSVFVFGRTSGSGADFIALVRWVQPKVKRKASMGQLGEEGQQVEMTWGRGKAKRVKAKFQSKWCLNAFL